MGIDVAQVRRLVEMAREEDLGAHGDLTSLLLPPEKIDATGSWSIRSRGAGRFCGRELLPVLCEILAPALKLEWAPAGIDGGELRPGSVIARLTGPVSAMLTAERTMLNFLQHLSGIATLTARYVDAARGTSAKIYDTRKTTPGLRGLEKYAVRCGGGHNHRTGLFDAVLIKDNHLAGVSCDRLAFSLFDMLNRVDRLPIEPGFVEVECDRLDQLAEVLKVVGIDVILLDNFATDELRNAVRMRDAAGLKGKVELEASGGVTLDRIRPIAETGVERIAVGAITHSAPILDLGLDAE